MCSAMDPLMRNLPITEADHKRKLEMDYKLGLGPALMPEVLSRVALVGMGVFLAFAIFGKDQ